MLLRVSQKLKGSQVPDLGKVSPCPRCSPEIAHVNLLSGLDSESQSDCFGDGDQRRSTRVAVHGQSAVRTLTLDACSLGNLGDALSLG